MIETIKMLVQVLVAVGIFNVWLIAGFWFPAIIRPGAIGLAALMLGAVMMHIKEGNPIMKSLPATSMFAMSLFVAFG